MVSFASLFEADPMEEATEQRQPSEVKMEVTRTPVIAAVTGPLPVEGGEKQEQPQQQQQQQQEPSSDQPMMEVPEQIVVNKKEKSSKKSSSSSSSSSPHKRRSSKDKEKVAKRKSSSKHERKHKRRSTSKMEEGGATLSKEERRKRRRSSKRHRKSSKTSEPDPNDPETLAKSRELLLAAMGVKKQPETAPCFVSNKTSLDSNPVYQSNKKRFSSGLPLTLSETQLASAASAASFNTANIMETARSMDDMSAFHDSFRGGMINNSPTPNQHQKPAVAADSEYDQYVEF